MFVHGSSEATVAEAVGRLQGRGEVHGVAGDLSDPAAPAAIAEAVAAVGRPDVLVNNAAVYEVKSYLDLDDEDWTRSLQTNLLAGAKLAQLFLPAMLESDWGRVVFVSSDYGVQVNPELMPYSVAKAAVIALGRGLAVMTRGTGVTVNTVISGPTWTEGSAGFLDAANVEGRPIEEVESRVLRAGRLPRRHPERALRRSRRSRRGGGVPLLRAGLGGDRRRPAGRRGHDQSSALMGPGADIAAELSRLVGAYAAAVDGRDLEALRAALPRRRDADGAAGRGGAAGAAGPRRAGGGDRGAGPVRAHPARGLLAGLRGRGGRGGGDGRVRLRRPPRAARRGARGRRHGPQRSLRRCLSARRGRRLALRRPRAPGALEREAGACGWRRRRQGAGRACAGAVAARGRAATISEAALAG